MLIDKSKVRRKRFKQRRALQSSDCALASKPMQGLYFDSRKDKTLIQVTELDGKRHQRTIQKEHISIVSEPKSKYFDHVTPGSGKAKDIASEILSLLNKRFVDTKQIVVIGCDSTAVNTGIKGGVVRLLEKSFKKPTQWFICLLHINELPLRHLFRYLNGPTTGPTAFSGAIGKAFQTCDKNPVVRFEPIESREPLQLTDVDDLSTDQNYLYEICLAVSSGQFHNDLAYKYPGNKAEHYSGLLHWERDHQKTEPPITMVISKKELCACIRDEKKLDEKLFDFPRHTQTVERCIKLVTEASCKVYGKDSQDGFVRATIESRN